MIDGVEKVKNNEVNAFLAHYGVMGMKWGVRKDESSKRTTRKNSSNKKVLKNILIGSAVVIASGAVITAGILAANKHKSSKTLDKAILNYEAAKKLQKVVKVPDVSKQTPSNLKNTIRKTVKSAPDYKMTFASDLRKDLDFWQKEDPSKYSNPYHVQDMIKFYKGKVAAADIEAAKWDAGLFDD